MEVYAAMIDSMDQGIGRIVESLKDTGQYENTLICFFSDNGGAAWKQLKGGLPTIAIRDIEIQKRENDLVLASFGRGFYILDDYSFLRDVSEEKFENEAILFKVKDADWYIPKLGKGSQGSSFFVAKNTPFGATFTYYIKDVPKTLKQIRREKEKELFKDKQPIPQPTMDQIREILDEKFNVIVEN